MNLFKGREYFSRELLLNLLNKSDTMSIPNEDVITSITEASVRSIVDSLLPHRQHIMAVVVSGGGARNQYITDRLTVELGGNGMELRHANNVDYVEALGMAIYAFRRKNNIPTTTLTTGSIKPVLLGELYC